MMELNCVPGKWERDLTLSWFNST